MCSAPRGQIDVVLKFAVQLCMWACMHNICAVSAQLTAAAQSVVPGVRLPKAWSIISVVAGQAAHVEIGGLGC